MGLFLHDKLGTYQPESMNTRAGTVSRGRFFIQQSLYAAYDQAVQRQLVVPEVQTEAVEVLEAPKQRFAQGYTELATRKSHEDQALEAVNAVHAEINPLTIQNLPQQGDSHEFKLAA